MNDRVHESEMRVQESVETPPTNKHVACNRALKRGFLDFAPDTGGLNVPTPTPPPSIALQPVHIPSCGWRDVMHGWVGVQVMSMKRA